VLLSEDFGSAKICDVGLAHIMGDTSLSSSSHYVQTTFTYAAPELLMNERSTLWRESPHASLHSSKSALTSLHLLLTQQLSQLSRSFAISAKQGFLRFTQQLISVVRC